MYTEITVNEQLELFPILKDFDLLEIGSITKNRKANVNFIYCIETPFGNYILRKSNPKTTTQQLAFEAEVLGFLVQKNFNFAPQIILSTTKKDFVVKNGFYYRLFSFLQGENRLEWNSRDFSMQEYISQFQFMAQLHSSLSEFQPQSQTDAPDVLTFLETFLAELDFYERIAQEKSCAFSKIMLEHIHFLKKETQNCLVFLKTENYSALPKQVIHGDVHFGNLLFTNNEVSGIVDFDWCGFETPLWDFAYCFSQNGSIWNGKEDGVLDFSLFNIAVKSYFGAKQLSPRDLRLLQILIKVGDLRAVKWEINSYYDLEQEEKYINFLQHTLRTLHMDQYTLLGEKT